MADGDLLSRYSQVYANATATMPPTSEKFWRQFAYDPRGHLAHRVQEHDYVVSDSPCRQFSASDTAFDDAYGGFQADYNLRLGAPQKISSCTSIFSKRAE